VNLSRLALVAIATARLTRFVTSDWLGEWTLVRPLKRWAVRAASPTHTGPRPSGWNPDDRDPDPDNGWRSKLVKGLDCPFCVGFWIGALVLLGEVVTRRWRPLRAVWTFALGALGLNYAVGHVSSRID
jgi:hypothetical protein